MSGRGNPDNLRTFLNSVDGRPFIRADIRDTKGSVPREAGAFMLISGDRLFGTIGGGALELEAIETARRILAGEVSPDTITDFGLGPESGQCCGGRVTVGYRVLGPDDHAQLISEAQMAADACPEVWLFGGGHVGRALASALLLLPVQVHVVETRLDELDQTPQGAARHLSAVPESLVPIIAPRGAAIILTHDHALDFLIVTQALERDDLAFIGMIGSQTKRARFTHQWHREGRDPAWLARLTCPIGHKIADKRPAVIAAMVAADVMASFA